MKYVILLFLSLELLSESTFITPLEYSTQLYKDPRGIGCQHCHGENGEGKLVAKYRHKNKKKEFRGPKITDLSFKSFFKALNKRNRGMPRYYLTRKEAQALYFYLHQEKNEK